MSSDSVVSHRSAEEAFAVLGNPLRVEILRAMAETPDEPVGFAALRKRVGERDSGNFNYHLGKLTGSFVRRADREDASGYELTVAGRQVVGALLAGVYTDGVSLSSLSVGSECPKCGGGLRAGYEDEHVVVRCSDCGEFENRHTFPPGTVEQFDEAELPAAFDRWLRASFARTVAGFCTTCSGRSSARLVAVEDADGSLDRYSFEDTFAQYTCERCGANAYSSVYTPLLHHPAGIAFFYDHGVDVTTAPSWDVAAEADEWSVERVAEDPLGVRITVLLDDEVLVATVDETVTVTDVERRPA